MPRIETYDAPDRRLTPSEQGNEAFTRAGRYVGQYYRQIADDARTKGELTREQLRQAGWPFDILALEQEGVRGAAGTPRGITVRAGGEEDPFGQFRGASFGGGGRGTTRAGYQPHGAASRGAGALGRVAASRLGSDGLPRQDSVIDPTTGQDLNALSPAQVARQNLAHALARKRYDAERNAMINGTTPADIANNVQATNRWGDAVAKYYRDAGLPIMTGGETDTSVSPAGDLAVPGGDYGTPGAAPPPIPTAPGGDYAPSYDTAPGADGMPSGNSGGFSGGSEGQQIANWANPPEAQDFGGGEDM